MTRQHLGPCIEQHLYLGLRGACSSGFRETFEFDALRQIRATRRQVDRPGTDLCDREGEAKPAIPP